MSPAASAVRTERRGAVFLVTIDRPEVRNAIDGPTARALADAFRAFEADDEACVAVLHGAGGTFCGRCGFLGDDVRGDFRRPHDGVESFANDGGMVCADGTAHVRGRWHRPRDD